MTVTDTHNTSLGWRKPRCCFTGDGKPKLRFDTRKEARQAANAAAAAYGESVERWRAYRCEECSYFHIGHVQVVMA